MVRTIAIVLALVVASPVARADLRVAIGNDAFTGIIPPFDDSGFTNDIAIAFRLPHGDYLLGGSLFDRWITEAAGPRRWDHLDLLATLERRWGQLHLRSLTLGGRLGPTFAGNLGGRWMQNAWHSSTGTGPTLDQGLQNRYDGDRKAAALAGLRVRASIGEANVQTYGVLDAQVTAGSTGVTYVDAAGGLRAVGHWRCVEFGTHGELAIARYHVGDPNLALPGGYGAGWQGEWRIGVHVAWRRYLVEYEYRNNEGGSGEPIGVIAFTIAYVSRSYPSASPGEIGP